MKHLLARPKYDYELISNLSNHFFVMWKLGYIKHPTSIQETGANSQQTLYAHVRCMICFPFRTQMIPCHV